VIFLPLLTAFFFSLLIVISLIFSVRHVELIGKDSINGTTIVKNKFIFFLSPDEIATRLMKLNADIESVSVAKKMPDTLVISVQKERVLGALAVANGYYYLSQNGKVIQKIQQLDTNSNYPSVSYYQKFDYDAYLPGSIIEQKDLQYGLYFLSSCSDFGAHIVKLDITNADMLVLKTDDDKLFIFTTLQQKEEQFEEFKIIYKKFTIEKTGFKAVDFRFDKPIVTL